MDTARGTDGGEDMRFTKCLRCQTTIGRHKWLGLTVDLDLTALDHTTLAAAWTTGRQVWKLHTIHHRPTMNYYQPTVTRARKHVGQPIVHTLLAGHDCTAAATDLAEALRTWQPQDAAPFQPAPKPPATQGAPF
jgi:hypothetical protein